MPLHSNGREVFHLLRIVQPSAGLATSRLGASRNRIGRLSCVACDWTANRVLALASAGGTGLCGGSGIRAPAAVRTAVAFRENGLGYSSRQWRGSESIAYINVSAKGVKLYSNGADALSVLTANEAMYLPAERSPFTTEVNPGYPAEIAAMCKEIREGRAFVVYFKERDVERWYLPTEKGIEAACHLPVLRRFTDGTVYGEKSR